MQENTEQPGGFAQLPKELLIIWPHLSDAHRLILPLLLSFMPNAFPSHETLARLSGRHRNTVRKCVQELVEVGVLVAVQRIRDRGGWASKQYHLADLKDPAAREAVLRRLRPAPRTSLHTHGVCSGDANTLHKHEVCSALHSHEVCSALHSHGVFSALHSHGVCTNGQVLTDNPNGQERRETAAAPPGGLPPAPHVPSIPWRIDPAPKVSPAPATATNNVKETGAKRDRRGAGKKIAFPATTDEQGERIRSSLEQMTNYLLYGTDGVADGFDASSPPPPTATNWRQFITVVDNAQQLNLERWTTQAWMGFYWYRVSKYRSERQIPLTLPVGFGRTGKTLKALQKAIGPMALFNLINDLTNHFDVVRYLFGGRYGTTLTLDETTLDRAEVRGVVQQIQAYGQEALAAIYQQMIEAAQGDEDDA